MFSSIRPYHKTDKLNVNYFCTVQKNRNLILSKFIKDKSYYSPPLTETKYITPIQKLKKSYPEIFNDTNNPIITSVKDLDDESQKQFNWEFQPVGEIAEQAYDLHKEIVSSYWHRNYKNIPPPEWYCDGDGHEIIKSIENKIVESIDELIAKYRKYNIEDSLSLLIFLLERINTIAQYSRDSTVIKGGANPCFSSQPNHVFEPRYKCSLWSPKILFIFLQIHPELRKIIHQADFRNLPVLDKKDRIYKSETFYYSGKRIFFLSMMDCPVDLSDEVQSLLSPYYEFEIVEDDIGPIFY